MASGLEPIILRIADMRFQEKVFEALLFYSSNAGRQRMPAIKEFLLSEVVAATVEYLSGKEYVFTYNRPQDGSMGTVDSCTWEHATNLAMEKAAEEFGDKLPADMKNALLDMTRLRFNYDALSKWYFCYLYSLCRYLCRGVGGSTYSPSVEFVTRVKKVVIPALGQEVGRHCKEIGRIMQKYAQNDVELISKLYRW